MSSYEQYKKLAIAETIIDAAKSIVDINKRMPNTGKRRNIFIKSYNRRPQNKKKRRLLVAQMAHSTFLNVMRIRNITQQAVPKFKSGSI